MTLFLAISLTVLACAVVLSAVAWRMARLGDLTAHVSPGGRGEPTPGSEIVTGPIAYLQKIAA